MKYLTTILVFAVSLLVFCCGDFFDPGYALELPKTPESWVRLLGEPHWRVEWLDSGGQLQKTDILPGSEAVIEIPVTWANPVIASPWWPEHGLIPGFFKPAGAIFPFDASHGQLRLSWEAGHDAVFYFELAFSNSQNASKLPANFDWMRFRELFKTGVLREEVCKDPWLVDWRNMAEKTISSNFDRRRLVPQAAVMTAIPVPGGPWYGTSPFAEPLFFTDGETPVFPVRPGVNVWVSPDGILRVNGSTWVFAGK